MSGPSTNPYSTVTQSGYNSSPPADDGTAVASNQVFWSTIKTKLGDPTLTLAQAINTQLLTTGGKTVNTDADVRNSLASGIAFESSGLTIASGSVTPSGRSFHVLTGEGSVADTLTNMAVTNVTAGQIIILSSADSAADITVSHNTGTSGTKFLLAGGADCVLGLTTDRLVVQYVSGTGWVEVCRSLSGGAAISIQTFLTPGTQTYTAPSGLTKVKVIVVGGGGGGGSIAVATQSLFGGGGGGGGAAVKLTALTATTIAVTVGAGGTAGTAGGAGGTGGTSSFAAYASATGGAGGATGTSGTPAGSGGVGSSGDLNIQGGPGSSQSELSTGATVNTGGMGGNSIIGGGAPAVASAAGAAGGAYGGGASGAHDDTGNARNGGTGASGAVIVEEYY